MKHSVRLRPRENWQKCELTIRAREHLQWNCNPFPPRAIRKFAVTCEHRPVAFGAACVANGPADTVVTALQNARVLESIKRGVVKTGDMTRRLGLFPQANCSSNDCSLFTRAIDARTRLVATTGTGIQRWADTAVSHLDAADHASIRDRVV